jgi:hypothetical protein
MEDHHDKNQSEVPVPVVNIRDDSMDDVRNDESTNKSPRQEQPMPKPEERENQDTKATSFGQDSTNRSPAGFRRNLWAEEGSQPPPLEFNKSEVSIPGKRRANGPLKKRLSPPPTSMRETENFHHPPPALLWSQTSSSVYPNSATLRPLLRQETSSLLQSHAKLPPLFHANPSLGQNLITEPLVETPKILGAIEKRKLVASSSSSAFQTQGMSLTHANSSVMTKPPPLVTNRLNTSDFAFHGTLAATEHWTLVERQEYEYLWSGTPMLQTIKGQDRIFLSQTTKTADKAANARQYHNIMHPFNTNARLLATQGPPARRPQFSPMFPTTQTKHSPKSAPKEAPKNAQRTPMVASPVSPPVRKTSSRVIRAQAASDSDWTPTPKRKTTIRFKVKVPKAVKVVKKSSKKAVVKVAKRAGKGEGGNEKPSFFIDVPVSNRPCKCGSSKCLKLYCECFHNAMFCDPDLCRCSECMNTEEHNSVTEPKGARALAIFSIVSRRPLAFAHGGRKAITDKEGCRCKNSRYAPLQLLIDD